MIRNFIQRFMYGRYGGDQLSIFLLVLYFILYLLGTLLHLPVLGYLGYIPILWGFYRILSRNYAGRRAENAKFMTLFGPLQEWFRFQRTKCRDKEHCYFKCPNCGQRLRAPRGKGKITITCRSCGARFDKKS